MNNGLIRENKVCVGWGVGGYREECSVGRWLLGWWWLPQHLVLGLINAESVFYQVYDDRFRAVKISQKLQGAFMCPCQR